MDFLVGVKWRSQGINSVGTLLQEAWEAAQANAIPAMPSVGTVLWFPHPTWVIMPWL